MECLLLVATVGTLINVELAGEVSSITAYGNAIDIRAGDPFRGHLIFQSVPGVREGPFETFEISGGSLGLELGDYRAEFTDWKYLTTGGFWQLNGTHRPILEPDGREVEAFSLALIGDLQWAFMKIEDGPTIEMRIAPPIPIPAPVPEPPAGLLLAFCFLVFLNRRST